MKKRILTIVILAYTCMATPFAAAESRLDAPVPLVDQIALADVLVLGELQSAVDEHEIELNASGETNAQISFLDVPVKVLQYFKIAEDVLTDDSLLSGDEFLLRMFRREGSPFFDSLVFPADPGRLVIMSLKRDTLVPQGKPAFVVQQQAFFTVEADTVSVLHDGETIDNLSLDQFEQLVKADRSRIDEELAEAEPANIAEQMLPVEIEELLEHQDR